MRRYAEVIGDPITHSKSPALHRFWLDALQLDGDYRAVRVPEGELGGYLAERRKDPEWSGCNVTAPLKQSVLPLLDGVTGAAATIGAVNCVSPRRGRLIGDNTDIEGIAEALPREIVAGSSAVLIGAGGAARAALHHLLASEAREIRILARRPEAAAPLRSLASGCWLDIVPLEQVRDFSRASLVVNASPLGTKGTAMPENLLAAVRRMGPPALVFDMVYETLQTPLLKAARESRLHAIDGLTMLIGQARRSFELFFGTAPPRHLDGALRRTLLGLPESQRLVLVGLPGAGKTSVGAALAERLGLDFFDSDREIERLSKMTISDYFSRHGEAAFRALEREVIQQLVEAPAGVIALGGGAFEDASTRALVRRSAISIWLDPTLELIDARIEGGERPLLKGVDKRTVLAKLAGSRCPAFGEADIRVPEASTEGMIGSIEQALVLRCRA
jgi:shikimate dehydrogenase